ncbi:MAG: hypothetical protein F9K29_07975 [Hyphomicrobiaceae bacterium]|nr:MAG: hypothetical protein F9K29_07975 [Hyphomicrobiaceae bacterium]
MTVRLKVAMLIGAICVGGAGAIAVKLTAPEQPNAMQAALSLAVADHLSQSRARLWSGRTRMALYGGAEDLDGRFIVWGELFGPEDDGVRRRAHLQALLSRVCDDVVAHCFSIAHVLVDGVPLPSSPPEPASELRGGSL